MSEIAGELQNLQIHLGNLLLEPKMDMDKLALWIIRNLNRKLTELENIENFESLDKYNTRIGPISRKGINKELEEMIGCLNIMLDQSPLAHIKLSLATESSGMNYLRDYDVVMVNVSIVAKLGGREVAQKEKNARAVIFQTHHRFIGQQENE